MCHNPLERKNYKIISNESIKPTIYEMVIEAPDIVKQARPGQFVNLYCNDQSKLLPRPISICELDQDKGYLRLIYALVGEGTRIFANMTAGQRIDVLGPLGHGFTTELDLVLDDQPIKKAKQLLIVGGGVGTPPLLELSKTIKKRYQEDIEITIMLGFRDDVYLAKDFEAYGSVFISTDSGKEGYHGHVIGLMEEQKQNKQLKRFDYIYACGPTPMLKGLQTFGQREGYEGEFSLEERMGCGFGACVGCVVAIKSDEDFDYLKVCKDGPVFDYRRVIFS